MLLSPVAAAAVVAQDYLSASQVVVHASFAVGRDDVAAHEVRREMSEGSQGAPYRPLGGVRLEIAGRHQEQALVLYDGLMYLEQRCVATGDCPPKSFFGQITRPSYPEAAL